MTNATPPDAGPAHRGLRGLARRASNGIDHALRVGAEYVRLELVLTVFCAAIPVLVVAGDHWALRDSISAYHSVARPEYFYFPLTVAAMLFVVNSAVRNRHWYNLWLGVALALLTFFNCDDYTAIHTASAAAFFAGNGAVFVVFGRRIPTALRWALAGAMVFVLAGHFFWHWYTLYWAESLSLWIIAFHFMLEARESYRVAPARRAP